MAYYHIQKFDLFYRSVFSLRISILVCCETSEEFGVRDICFKCFSFLRALNLLLPYN